MKLDRVTRNRCRTLTGCGHPALRNASVALSEGGLSDFGCLSASVLWASRLPGTRVNITTSIADPISPYGAHQFDDAGMIAQSRLMMEEIRAGFSVNFNDALSTAFGRPPEWGTACLRQEIGFRWLSTVVRQFSGFNKSWIMNQTVMVSDFSAPPDMKLVVAGALRA